MSVHWGKADLASDCADPFPKMTHKRHQALSWFHTGFRLPFDQARLPRRYGSRGPKQRPYSRSKRGNSNGRCRISGRISAVIGHSEVRATIDRNRMNGEST